MKTITTLILILVSFISLSAQTVVSGGDVFGEWKTVDSPFLIEGDIYLQPEDRLVIRPGVQVIFQDYYSFDIAGRIEILGTETDSILFTVQDTTGYFLGDHAGWNGLIFNGIYSTQEEFSIIQYCSIEYSKISGIMCLYYPQLKISDVDIRFNQTAGITLYQNSDIEITNLHVHDNMEGGISCNSSGPLVNGFIVNNNMGSGICIYENSTNGVIPTFTNGIIINNIATNNGGGICLWDAGIYAENLEIKSNIATNGGGVYSNMSNGEFRNVTISANIAENGGGIQCESFSNIMFDHVLVSDNQANAIGGGVYVYEANVDLINATIVNNSANMAGGLYYNLFSLYESEVANSIIWNNVPDEIFFAYEAPEINFSNIQGGILGNGNISEDPLFADPSNKDYRLQWSDFPEENGVKSPCIDAGDPSSIYDPDGTISDMGAYYYDQVIYTALDEKLSSSETLVYPNPVINELLIKGNKDISKIQIVNLMGQPVLEQYSNGQEINIIDLSGINPGMHILNIYDNQGLIATKKIVKK